MQFLGQNVNLRLHNSFICFPRSVHILCREGCDILSMLNSGMISEIDCTRWDPFVGILHCCCPRDLPSQKKLAELHPCLPAFTQLPLDPTNQEDRFLEKKCESVFFIYKHVGALISNSKHGVCEMDILYLNSVIQLTQSVSV